VVRFNSKGIRLSSLGHWANGVKEDGFTGLGFLTKDGFTEQDGQTENQKWFWNIWDDFKMGEEQLRILQLIWKNGTGSDYK